MDPDFWRARWRDNQIGFHQAKTNELLERFRGDVNRGEPGSVLVPLAGKSRDLSWLAAQGDRVTGIELVESAVAAFFSEQSIEVSKETRKEGVRYEGRGITFWAGDYFRVGKKAIGHVDWIFDRAALIALPEAMRERYVEHTGRFLEKGGEILLITIEYDPKVGGPPFSIPTTEVQRLYGGAFTIETLARTQVPSGNPRFVEAGIIEVAEVAYRLVKVA